MDGNRTYYFMSMPLALLFWLLLNYMFSAPYVEALPKQVDVGGMLSSTIFVAMAVLAFAELALIWFFIIPMAKKGSPLVAYVAPEVPLMLGFIAAFNLQSVTPYFYFLPFWAAAMAIVYREIYSGGE